MHCAGAQVSSWARRRVHRNGERIVGLHGDGQPSALTFSCPDLWKSGCRCADKNVGQQKHTVPSGDLCVVLKIKTSEGFAGSVSAFPDFLSTSGGFLTAAVAACPRARRTASLSGFLSCRVDTARAVFLTIGSNNLCSAPSTEPVAS